MFNLRFTEFLFLFNCAVMSVKSDYYEVSSISSQQSSTTNFISTSSNVENALQCARKCFKEGCSSFEYGVSDCYKTTSGEYTGRQSKTASGETCQRWDSQIPHDHFQTNFEPNITDAENYCRDPDDDGRPWCYTLNPDIRYDYCDVDKCDREFTHERCYSDALSSSDYVGAWSKTRTGKMCQRWDAQTPNAHSYTSATIFPDATLSAAENYCRDPSGFGYTWCFTTDPGTKWEACDVTSCTKYLLDKGCYTEYTSSDYAGSWDVTIDVIPCQPWVSQSPHAHNYTDDDDFPNDNSIADAANYCRSMDSFAPWCYTMDEGVRWQTCGIHKCHPNHVTCYDGPTLRSYMGTRSKTETGKLCQRWDSQEPHSHSLTADMFEEDTLFDAENFCRDPTGSGELWCYTTDPGIPTESCGIGKCSRGEVCATYKDSSLYPQTPAGSEYYTMSQAASQP